MANVNLQNSTPSSLIIPSNYPDYPAPGKISLLFDENYDKLYHRFNARDYDDGNIWFGSNQPYIYRYPDEPPSKLRQFGNRGLPLGQGIDDLERMTKFIVSGRGLLFIGKQFLLQGYQPFDETNLYNPTEVILSAAANLAGGLLDKPKRHIDKSGGLLGGLAGLIGVSVSRGNPPASTVAAGGGKSSFLTGLVGGGNREEEVLPVQNYGQGTGLLRARTALKAKGILQAKWGTDQTSGPGGGILGMVKNLAKSVFPQLFRAGSQSGIDQRADELAYDWMFKYYNNYTAQNAARGTQKSGLGISFMGIIGINIKKQSPTGIAAKISEASVSLFQQKYYHKTEDGSVIYSDGKEYIVGPSPTEGVYIRGPSQDDENSQIKERFYNASDKSIKTDNLQKQKNTYFDEEWWKVVEENSTITKGRDLYIKPGETVKSGQLVEESLYNERYEGKVYSNLGGIKANKRAEIENTKLNRGEIVSEINDNLKRVIDKINEAEVYTTNFSNTDTWLLSSGKPSKQGYDRLWDIAKESDNNRGLNKNYINSVRMAYVDSNKRTLDDTMNSAKNYGFARPGRADKINTLTVLDGKVDVGPTKKWNPYEDDIIAFFFYDVVNDKYIPFRATVKGINESNSAEWDVVKYIGRADQLYSYSGFRRSLSFSFTVVVGSILELYPVWQRINYLASAVKPSAYVNKNQGNIINRFIVPPMFMLTMGDLYKYQPVVINNVGVVIPDDASWETVPESSEEEWSHLADIIKTTHPKGGYGQVPMVADISIQVELLEKEIPITGGNHYGHAPASFTNPSGYEDSSTLGSPVPYLPKVEEFSKNIRY